MDTFPLVLSAQMNEQMNGMTAMGVGMVVMMLLVAILLVLGIAALLRSFSQKVG